MITKDKILEEIKRTARENGGNPLGINQFSDKTGIKPYDWKKFWARFGDAQKEAGFVANQFNSAFNDEFIIKKMIGLMRKLDKFPTHGELRIEKSNDAEFPNSKSLFDSKEQKRKLAYKIIEWCKERFGYDDIVKLCAPFSAGSLETERSNDNNPIRELGEVYLFKSGKYVKIGKTYDTVQRGKELRIQLPEKMELIHSIKTDDPSGVELYWHRRFESKRMNGEWFDLSSPEIRAFKRWRIIS
ncbi:hypothetical protein A3J34_01855 [Candidatus Peribacteria bacterium RIFCSPLOWO2_02_FULL_51_10]|nr:MAG: hypothetical protein A3J34_01855 [Candidatus Peribacteria bacterium RIFCSPLOWO2_02_FULL_51_10]